MITRRASHFARAGHRITSNRQGQSAPRSHKQVGYGWEYTHVCIDDYSRVSFSQIDPNEKAVSAVTHLKTAIAWYKTRQPIERVMTDNGYATNQKLSPKLAADREQALQKGEHQ